MTEKEVLQLQETNGQKAFYLMAVGMFYHAYGCGSFALARVTGYCVLRKHRKRGDILTCGFPASQLDTVLQRIRDGGGEVEQTGEKTFLFCGLNGTPDESMIAEAKPKAAVTPQRGAPQIKAHYSWLADKVLSFNLSLSTPMDAMNLIASLQRRLRDEQQKQQEPQEESPRESATEYRIACESPAGQGLQE